MKSKQYSSEYAQISIAQPPGSVLENFVTNLSVPVRKIEELLPLLREITQQGDSGPFFFEFSQALTVVNQNIALVLDYLNSRLRNDISNLDGTAESILATFTHELREVSTPLAGYVAVCEQGDLTEDKLEHFIAIIENSGKTLIEIFKALEKNWRTCRQSELR